MTREYIVLSTYTDKQTGKPVSSLAPISSGISKASGSPYEIANLDARETVDGAFPVGTRLAGTLSLAVKSGENVPQEPKPNLKLGGGKE